TPVPTPTPGSNPDMFQAPMQGNGNQITGQIQVNASSNNGAGTLTLTGAPANASLTLQFCPFDPDTYGKGGAPCYNVTTVMTDASGTSSSTFQYPKTGVFFGRFVLMQGTTEIAEDGFTYTTTPDFHASIQRAAGVSDVDWSTFTLGNDPITSGSFSVHGPIVAV